MQFLRKMILLVRVASALLATLSITIHNSPRNLCFAEENSQGAAAQSPAGLICSAQSGAWSAPATWAEGKVPGADARVQIREGHVVVYDLKSEQPIRLVHVAGTLTFDRGKDTRLDVGLIKIQAGDDASEDGFDCEAHLPNGPVSGPRPALEVGTPDRPIAANHTAVIRLIDCDGVDKDSWPAIVCCGGQMDFHGAPLNHTWVKLGETAKKEHASVTLAEPVEGWRVGDRIILTGTKERKSGEYRRSNVETEERIVQAIEGKKLTLDKPLEYEHFADGDYRGEVANLSRNVIVESAEPDKARGHTMYHRGSAGSISYAEFRHLGKQNTLGRYSLHFHLVGDTMRGSSVIGASIWDSGNRWLTIHGTNYLVVRDCVGYRSIGHGFFLEDGTEINNVLDHNLAVQAFAGKSLRGQALPFDRNDGAGFWWANSLNTFTRNVACENERYGYRFEATPTSRLDLTMSVQQPDGTRQKVDIRTLPFVRFQDNECHSDGLYGFNLGEGVDRIGPDERHPFVIRNMKIWATHYALRVQSPSVLLEKVRIHRCRYGMYFLDPDRHVYRDLVISETPDEPWSSSHGDASIQHGVVTVDGLVFENIRSTYNILIPLTHHNASGSAASHFRNVKLVNWTGGNQRALANLYDDDSLKPTPNGVPMYFHDYFGPKRHAKLVSARAADLLSDGNTYREVPLLTGSRSRVAEVQDVEFPKLLDPVDDRPPATVITHASRPAPGKLLVRGTTSDDGTVTRVLVNGREAKPAAPNFAEWEIALDAVKLGEMKLTAHAEDAAGNVEKLPAVRSSLHTEADVNAVKQQPNAKHAGSATDAASSPTAEQPTAPTRPLKIQGADKEIVKARINGPQFHPPELFQGFEDYYNPRLKRLRDEYELDKVVEGEPSEFRRMLKLRHWVHSRWPIDNNQQFSDDAFAILEQAKTGAGFNCSHSMAVQQAVMSSLGYIARNLGVDCNHEELGRNAHHGVNEVWSNEYAKWILLDAKYDIHFERDGVPLSALELHEGVRADGGRGIVKMQGVDRRQTAMRAAEYPENGISNYWWVSFHVRQDPFSHRHWSGGNRLVVLDNAAFRETTWHRDHGAGLTKHWAYAARAFVPTDWHQIEWTPGVPDLRVRHASPQELEVDVRSATPNFETYVVCLNGGESRAVADGHLRWKLQPGENTLQVRSRNLFGVEGPPVTVMVRFE